MCSPHFLIILHPSTIVCSCVSLSLKCGNVSALKFAYIIIVCACVYDMRVQAWPCQVNVYLLLLYVHMYMIWVYRHGHARWMCIYYYYCMCILYESAGMAMHNVQMEVRGQLFKTDYFLLPWDPGTKLGWSDLHGKWFYPLSHLTGLCLLILSAFIVRLQSFWNVGPMPALLHSTSV